MSLWQTFEISASGLGADRARLEVVANNIANAGTTRTPEGGPFRRQVLLVQARRMADGSGGGVDVLGTAPDAGPPRMEYDPGHPDADKAGYVAYPNISVVTEMVDLINATRGYEANLTVFNETKSMALRALDILR